MNNNNQQNTQQNTQPGGGQYQQGNQPVGGQYQQGNQQVGGQYQQGNQQVGGQYQQNTQQGGYNQYQQNTQQGGYNQYQQNTQPGGYNQYQQNNTQGFVDKLKDFILNTPVEKEPISPQDIADNKTISIFAYFGILFFIPLLACKNSRYARFHSNQGLVYFLFSIVLSIAQFIVTALLGCIPILGGILNLIINIAVYAVSLTLLIVGIYNVVKGRANELPVIGKIRIIQTVAQSAPASGYNQNMNNAGGYNQNMNNAGGYNQNMNNANGYNQNMNNANTYNAAPPVNNSSANNTSNNNTQGGSQQ